MKVIFLDFDGVLNGSHDIFDNGIKVPEEVFKERLEKRIKILGEICKECDAKIVIESSYKDCMDEETLETDVKWIQDIFNLMKKYGIELVGRTPNLCDVRENYDGNPTIWKEDEILGYLDKHPEVENYCVIDDDDLVTNPDRKRGDYSRSDLNKVRDHLVTTIWYSKNPEEEALLDSHKELVKRILKKTIKKQLIL